MIQIEMFISHNEIYCYVQRRKLIKSVGGAAIGSLCAGRALATNRSRSSVAAYEDYCHDLSKRYGAKMDGTTSVQRSDGTRMGSESASPSIDDYKIKREIRNSGGDYSKEIFNLDNKEKVTQFSYVDGEDVVVWINGEKFVIDKQDLERVLRQRLRKAERDRKRKLENPHNGEINYNSSQDNVKSSDGPYIGESLSNYETSHSTIPITSSFDKDVNFSNGSTDRLELAGSGTGAGYANVHISAWDSFTLDSNTYEVSVTFNGDYSAAAANALGVSDLEFEFIIASSTDNKVQTSSIYHSGFVADLWTKHDDYSIGIYDNEFDYEELLVGIHARIKAAAPGYSTATVDAYTGGSEFLSYDGYLNLDEYILDLEIVK